MSNSRIKSRLLIDINRIVQQDRKNHNSRAF